MIMPMKKIFLVVQDKRQEESLKMLRKIGVVHLERKAVSSVALTKLLDRKAKAEMVLRVLKLYEKPDEKEGQKKENTIPAGDLIGQVLECLEERKTLQEHSIKLISERNRLA